jgi:hypothetical protein
MGHGTASSHILPGRLEMLLRGAWARSVGQRRDSSARLAAVRELRTWVRSRVSCAAVVAVKPSAGKGHSSGNRICRNCLHAVVELVGAEKGCRLVAAAERADAARVTEEVKAAEHTAGGKSLTPKPPSRKGRCS